MGNFPLVIAYYVSCKILCKIIRLESGRCFVHITIADQSHKLESETISQFDSYEIKPGILLFIFRLIDNNVG